MSDAVRNFAEKLQMRLRTAKSLPTVSWLMAEIRAELKPLLDAAQAISDRLRTGDLGIEYKWEASKMQLEIEALAAELKHWRKG